MKTKLIIVIIFLFFGTNIKSQTFGVYIGGGYNSCSFHNLSRLDFIIDEYNNTRSFLTTKMPHISSMSGASFNVGLYLWNFFGEMEWLGRTNTVYAEGNPTGSQVVRRDIKMRSNSINFATGYCFPFFALGVSADIGSVPVFTRVYNSGDTPPGYTGIGNSDIMIGITAFAELKIPISKGGFSHIIFKPYYQFPLSSADYGDLNAILNPNTYLTDNSPESDIRKNLGFEIKLQLGFGDK